jgi:hypothetical protein
MWAQKHEGKSEEVPLDVPREPPCPPTRSPICWRWIRPQGSSFSSFQVPSDGCVFSGSGTLGVVIFFQLEWHCTGTLEPWNLLLGC